MKKRVMAAVTASAAVAALGLMPGAAHASDNERITTSTEGAAIGLTVDWTSFNSVVLRDVYLKDTGNDGNSVFFYVSDGGFRYPDHKNKSGYNTTVHWDALPGSTSGGYMYFITVTVCRDKLFDNCTTSRQSHNPYTD
ncbi:hypothetical protein [Streptomyces sp. NBC_00388]|uniref:hypothetical protein n=1 Tax=Streptomyces sp. NBC_00388 TaxID=2975735 RepID=UPI002E23395F